MYLGEFFFQNINNFTILHLIRPPKKIISAVNLKGLIINLLMRLKHQHQSPSQTRTYPPSPKISDPKKFMEGRVKPGKESRKLLGLSRPGIEKQGSFLTSKQKVEVISHIKTESGGHFSHQNRKWRSFLTSKQKVEVISHIKIESGGHFSYPNRKWRSLLRSKYQYSNSA